MRQGDCITKCDKGGYRHVACPVIEDKKARPPHKCSYYPGCSCLPAKFGDDGRRCPGCDKTEIFEGDCLINSNGKWCHTACPIRVTVPKSLGGGAASADFRGKAAEKAIRKALLPWGREPLLRTHPAAPLAIGGAASSSHVPPPQGGAAASSAYSHHHDHQLALYSNPASSPKRPPPTAEQQALLDYVAAPGELIRANARAGSGKTTTAAMLSNELLRRDGQTRILYVVFNKKAEQEAKTSGKFDAEAVTIRTTHAFAKNRVFKHGQPINYVRRNVVRDHLKVGSEVRKVLRADPAMAEVVANKRKIGKVIGQVVGYVCKTVELFCQGDTEQVSEEHVPWRAKPAQAGSKTSWKKLFGEEWWG